MIQELKTRYETYHTKAREVRKNAPVFAGAFGFGGGPKSHPCHETFFEDVEKWTKAFLQTNPDQDKAMEAAMFMVETPMQYREQESFWYMHVCVGNVRDMIPYLRPEDCAVLAARIDALYKRKDKSPVVVDTCKKLWKASK